MEYNNILIKSISAKNEKYIKNIIVKDDMHITLKIEKDESVYYSYLILHKCEFCLKPLYVSIKSMKKTGYAFCNHNCQHCYTRLMKDEKNANILNNKSSNFYYLLGLLATDGTIIFPAENNKYKAHSVRIQLQVRDELLLQKIQNEFGGSLKYSKKYVTWEISNKPFLEYLIYEVGFTPKKSKTLNITKWFNTLNQEQQRHFIRGCWDGDGTLYKRSDSYIISAFVTASFSFFEMIKQFFQSFEYKVYNSITIYNATIFKISFHGKRLIAPMQLLYNNIDDSDLFLERKKLNFSIFEKEFKDKV